MGVTVKHVVAEQYASVTDGLPWIQQVIYKGYAVDPFGAKQQHPDAIITMVGNNDPMPLPTDKTFAHVQWERTGVPLELFDSLPLILENRNETAETKVVTDANLDGRPLILFNTTHNVSVGRPAGFSKGPALLRYLIERFPQFQFVNLGPIKAPRIIDLMGLYEIAKLIVSADTATLHLANAVRNDGTPTPVVALVLDSPYHRSARRKHWLAELTYTQATDFSVVEKEIASCPLAEASTV